MKTETGNQAIKSKMNTPLA